MRVHDRERSWDARKVWYRKTIRGTRRKRQRRYANDAGRRVVEARHARRDDRNIVTVRTQRLRKRIDRRNDSILNRSVTFGEQADAPSAHRSIVLDNAHQRLQTSSEILPTEGGSGGFDFLRGEEPRAEGAFWAMRLVATTSTAEIKAT